VCGVYISIISKSDTFALYDVNCAYNKVWAIVFLYYETHVHIIVQAFYCCLVVKVKIFVPLKHCLFCYVFSRRGAGRGLRTTTKRSTVYVSVTSSTINVVRGSKPDTNSPEFTTTESAMTAAGTTPATDLLTTSTGQSAVIFYSMIMSVHPADKKVGGATR